MTVYDPSRIEVENYINLQKESKGDTAVLCDHKKTPKVGVAERATLYCATSTFYFLQG